MPMRASANIKTKKQTPHAAEAPEALLAGMLIYFTGSKF